MATIYLRYQEDDERYALVDSLLRGEDDVEEVIVTDVEKAFFVKAAADYEKMNCMFEGIMSDITYVKGGCDE